MIQMYQGWYIDEAAGVKAKVEDWAWKLMYATAWRPIAPN